MKAWTLAERGLEDVKLVEVPTPRPGSNELLVRVGAVSLNFRDKAIIDGNYPIERSGPLILASDASGVVAEVGPGVTRFRVGDRVTAHFLSRWIDGEAGADEMRSSLGGPLPGGLAEFMILPEEAAVASPATLSDVEAATLPIAALTAWFALVERAGIGARHTVLIQGTGGVSIFAVQLAAALGARVIATSSSDAKLARVQALGATDLINYATTPDWQDVALALTGGRGVDQVLDVVGGSGINRSIAAARVGGHVTAIGFLGGQRADVDLIPLIVRQTRVQAVTVGHRRSFEAMNRFIEEQRIKPVIDSTYPFAAAIAAFEHLNRGPFGKVVVTVAS